MITDDFKEDIRGAINAATLWLVKEVLKKANITPDSQAKEWKDYLRESKNGIIDSKIIYLSNHFYLLFAALCKNDHCHYCCRKNNSNHNQNNSDYSAGILNTKNLVDLTRLCGWHWKCCAGF